MGSTQVAMCVVATGTVAAGSYRSLQLDTLAGQNQEVKEALVTMQPGTAMLFPVVASIALLTLFYFVGDIGVIIISLTCFSNGSENRGGAIGLVCAVLCVGGWLLTGHWLYNNGVTLKGTLLTTTVMGVCACTMAVSLIRLPNSKVATLLFSLLFVYDAFWVFASEPLFGSNVMVSVATSEPRNPLHFVISGLLHINTTIPETLDLPAKLILPDLSKPSGASMLGLGDIALPGLLAALSLRLDVKRGRRAGVAFGATMAGYAVGIVLAMLAVYIFRVAQPALIYLVPGVLLPLHYVAWTRGFLMELWNGNTDTAYPEPKKSEDPDQVELETAPLV